MRKITLITLILISATSSVFGAAPDTLWTRTFGGASHDWAWYVEETSDQGYVVTGYTTSTPHGDRDIYIVKLSKDGSFAWENTYGLQDCAEEAGCAKVTRDGGLIVGGYAAGQFGDESANYYLMKLDAAGNLLWDQDYDYNLTTDYGTDVCQTLNGGYVMVGSSYYWSSLQGAYDWGINIVRTDSLGVKQNHILVDKPWIQHLNRVIPTSDSGAIAIGTAGAIYLVKIDKYGDTTWTKGYGGVGTGWSIVQLADGGYMAFGDREFSSPEGEDFWLLRLTPSGDTLWSRRYRNPSDDLGYGLDQCSDGGFVMTGEAYRNAGMDPTDVYVVRTNANGDTLWTKTVGGDLDDRSYCVKQTSDGGFIIVGRTQSFGAGEYDMYVVKLAPENPTGMAETPDTRPVSFALGANYPNPFNLATMIEFSLPQRARATIDIFDILGRKVRTLMKGTKSAGSHRVEWDGRDDSGEIASTGVYLYRLQAGEFVQTRKMVLLK